MRLNIRLDGSAENLLNGLCERTGRSPRDIVLEALAVFNYAARRTEEGGKLGVVDREGNFSELVTQSLENLATKAADSDAAGTGATAAATAPGRAATTGATETVEDTTPRERERA